MQAPAKSKMIRWWVGVVVWIFFMFCLAGAPALNVDDNDRSAPDSVATTIAHYYTTMGFLTLGMPLWADQVGCILCRLTRESGAEFAAVAHPNGGPSRIILMRHADKPDDPYDSDLSEAGAMRAQHIATYIPQTFGKPDYIIATARSEHSNRPLETVTPLGAALGVKIQHDFEDDDFEDLVDDIFSNPAYHGKIIVVCWHHGKLPALAALLGAPRGSYPDPWPEDAYNIILDFHYDSNSGDPPTVARVIEPF
jgi:hypothetical protein